MQIALQMIGGGLTEGGRQERTVRLRVVGTRQTEGGRGGRQESGRKEAIS
jgi:hypothetical protein